MLEQIPPEALQAVLQSPAVALMVWLIKDNRGIRSILREMKAESHEEHKEARESRADLRDRVTKLEAVNG